MSIELATLIVTCVVIFANGLGAAVNNARYSKLREDLTPIRERLVRLETMVRAGNGLPPPGE